VGDIVKSYVFIPFRRPGDGSLQPVYGLGWTLNYEMFFYVCFAGLLALRAGWAIGVLVAVFSGIVAAGYWLTPQSAPLQFWSQPIILEFVLGALVGYAYLSGVRVPRPVGLAAVALAACFFLAATGGTFPQGAFDRLWMLGAPAALALAGATLVNQSPREGAVWRGLAMLGDASYALYLIHPMLIRALNMVWTKLGLAPQVGWPFIIVALLLSLASAVVVYRWFERPLTLWLQGRSRS